MYVAFTLQFAQSCTYDISVWRMVSFVYTSTFLLRVSHCSNELRTCVKTDAKSKEIFQS